MCPLTCTQVRGVLDAMPSTNLKPENEEDEAAAGDDVIYRTTYMFSATMPPAVERLARKYMRRPVVVNIGSAGKATDNVSQVCCVLIESPLPFPAVSCSPVRNMHVLTISGG